MSSRLSLPRRARLLGLALLVTTFLVGTLAGAAFSRALVAREPAPPPVPGWHCHGPHGGKKGSAIFDQLDLTPQQRAQVDRIMERRRAETAAFWERDGARLRGIVDSTRAEIRAVLTPEQREKYERLRAEHRARRRAEKKR